MNGWTARGDRFVKMVGAYLLTIDPTEAGEWVWVIGREEEEEMDVEPTLDAAMREAEAALDMAVEELWIEMKVYGAVAEMTGE